LFTMMLIADEKRRDSSSPWGSSELLKDEGAAKMTKMTQVTMVSK